MDGGGQYFDDAVVTNILVSREPDVEILSNLQTNESLCGQDEQRVP